MIGTLTHARIPAREQILGIRQIRDPARQRETNARIERMIMKGKQSWMLARSIERTLMTAP